MLNSQCSDSLHPGFYVILWRQYIACNLLHRSIIFLFVPFHFSMMIETRFRDNTRWGVWTCTKVPDWLLPPVPTRRGRRWGGGRWPGTGPALTGDQPLVLFFYKMPSVLPYLMHCLLGLWPYKNVNLSQTKKVAIRDGFHQYAWSGDIRNYLLFDQHSNVVVVYWSVRGWILTKWTRNLSQEILGKLLRCSGKYNWIVFTGHLVIVYLGTDMYSGPVFTLSVVWLQ